MPIYVIIKSEDPTGPSEPDIPQPSGPTQDPQPTGPTQDPQPSGPTQDPQPTGPSETYTLLDYIQGGGNNGAYIDTGVIAKANQGFCLQMKTSTGINGYLIGFIDSNNSLNTWDVTLNNNAIKVDVSDRGEHNIGNQIAEKIELNFNAVNNHHYYILGSSGYTKTNSFSNSNDSHWLLFAYTYTSNNTIYVTNFSYRVYNFIIYEGSTVIKYFKPARRNSDNVIGMLDTINNEFYTSANSATFTGGSDSSPIVYPSGPTEDPYYPSGPTEDPYYPSGPTEDPQPSGPTQETTTEIDISEYHHVVSCVIRSGPGTNYSQIGSTAYNDNLYFSKKTSDNQWYYCPWSPSGWISSSCFID